MAGREKGTWRSQLEQHCKVPAPRVSHGAAEPGLPPASTSSLEGRQCAVLEPVLGNRVPYREREREMYRCEFVFLDADVCREKRHRGTVSPR